MTEQWFVVKIETDQGFRLGINMEAVKPLAGPLHFMDAARECTEISKKLKIPEFNHNKEKFLCEVE